MNEVRVGASEGLQRLCKVCGADWLQEKVLPRIHGFYDESTFYLIRIAILNALKKLANGEVRNRCRVRARSGSCWLLQETVNQQAPSHTLLRLWVCMLPSMTVRPM